ncbi:MAG: HDIG domain-containing protein [Ignavibacteria bacterium]|nr:HDIG domain-containing protein [Ignavibacteria bacterium]MBT8383267.1 HDIG domain-containing protein [Ignavibacteria bacterium]MBT8390372.1 HDIG domain-containing protein [Ignavibacteria bacterium]NNJ53368.1 HDIG domain-containing protein [Ignavibacteriaceae bacterium]NNL21617.1 HDIG domain-containing protein [Ignavibacteriaceae bacterium]
MSSEMERTKRGFFIKIIIGFITVVLIVLMFPKGESIEFEVSEGAIWLYDDLIAPFSFPVKKAESIYQAELNQARVSVYPVFLNKPENKNVSIDSLRAYSLLLIKTIDFYIDADSVPSINPTFLSTTSFSKFLNLRVQERNLITGRIPGLNKLFSSVESIILYIYSIGVLDVEEGSIMRDSIAVRTGNFDRIEPISKYFSLGNAKDEVEKEIKKLNYPKDVETAAIEFAVHFVFSNIAYSKELTEEEIRYAEGNVSSYSGIVNENERIIARHDRITKDVKLKIESYKDAKGDMIGNESLFLQALGKFIHISLILSLLVAYIFLFRKKIYYDNNKIILFALVILFVSLITFLINQVEVQAPMQYLIFIPAASMLITIMFDSRIGFYSTVILTLITGALRGNDYTFMAMNLIAGGIAVYSVRDIKNRSQIFRSFLFILLGYLLGIIAFGLERFAPWSTILVESAFAASNALISPALTYGLLIFFERLFNITTDLTLLELSNFDKPLLKELSRKAPGTFNHSMTMGTIAEAAAEKIGANPLLARVGAYYHDVGKTITPHNFVENQLNNQNVHENLTSEESVKLIARHVNEGIALAKDHNLPQEIVDFIPMHHGTMAMTYFYERAKKIYGEEKVNAEDFRYPGPKPNTKETAIVMLADGCESAVRSIENPDPDKVENIIKNIFKGRISDGQLDEAPITFKDIAQMREEFLNILLGQHHKRIKYPKQDETEKGIETAEKE